MKSPLTLLALLLASGLPVVASAQGNPAETGPSTEIRAQLQQARDAAKAAAFNDLGPTSRAKVQTIVDQVNNGQITDLRAAAQQIDAAISPAEAKAVLAERDKMIQAFHAVMPQRAEGPGPNASAHQGGNDAGRFLLSLGVSREKLRELRHKQQPQS